MLRSIRDVPLSVRMESVFQESLICRPILVSAPSIFGFRYFSHTELAQLTVISLFRLNRKNAYSASVTGSTHVMEDGISAISSAALESEGSREGGKHGLHRCCRNLRASATVSVRAAEKARGYVAFYAENSIIHKRYQKAL